MLFRGGSCRGSPRAERTHIPLFRKDSHSPIDFSPTPKGMQLVYIGPRSNQLMFEEVTAATSVAMAWSAYLNVDEVERGGREGSFGGLSYSSNAG